MTTRDFLLDDLMVFEDSVFVILWNSCDSVMLLEFVGIKFFSSTHTQLFFYFLAFLSKFQFFLLIFRHAF